MSLTFPLALETFADVLGVTSATFVLNESGKSSVGNPQGDTEEKILEAAENCPVSAITVEDAETGERRFP